MHSPLFILMLRLVDMTGSESAYFSDTILSHSRSNPSRILADVLSDPLVRLRTESGGDEYDLKSPSPCRNNMLVDAACKSFCSGMPLTSHEWWDANVEFAEMEGPLMMSGKIGNRSRVKSTGRVRNLMRSLCFQNKDQRKNMFSIFQFLDQCCIKWKCYANEH